MQDRLIHMLEVESSAAERLEDFLSAHSSSPAETQSPRHSLSPTADVQDKPTRDYGSHRTGILGEEMGSQQPLNTHVPTLLPSDDIEPARGPSVSAKITFTIPQALSLSLIELFFDKIQPWLPMLHRPRFFARYADRLNNNSNYSQNLLIEEALLLYGMFSLAARFSPSPFFEGIPPVQRGHQFVNEARKLYDQARAINTPTILYLQGCILLAFYFYSSEPCAQGWILTGVCVRIAYDLDLADVDADDPHDLTPVEWIEREEMRRAWWLVWELDTFGSTVSNRTYTIDRRRMAVQLPVSDEVWFSGIPQSSAKFNTRPGQSWKSLQACDKQNHRACFLLSNFLLSMAQDMSQRKEGVSADEKLILENDVNCFKLSLPASFGLETGSLAFDSRSFAKSNWIIGTNLMLMSTAVVLSSIKVVGSDDYGSMNPISDPAVTLRMRAIEFSRIVSRWSPGYIHLSHPFLAGTMLPVCVSDTPVLASQPIIASSQELSKLLLTHYAEYWKIGSLILRESDSPLDDLS